MWMTLHVHAPLRTSRTRRGKAALEGHRRNDAAGCRVRQARIHRAMNTLRSVSRTVQMVFMPASRRTTEPGASTIGEA